MEDRIYEVTEIKSAETLAVKIRTTVRNTQKIMLDAAISIGQDLIDAKELVSHRDWENWLENSVGFSQSSANKYMKISREFGEISKTELIPNLSYTKALKLLAVPEEDREEFIKNTDIDNLTVKELEEKIKELQKENDTIRALAKETTELEETRNQMEENMRKLKNRIQELEIEAEADQGPSEEVKKEIEKKKVELETSERKIDASNKKIEKLQEEVKNLKESQGKAVEEAKASTLEEAREIAKKELEEEMSKLMTVVEDANKARMEAEKKLQSSSNQDLMNFKFLIDEIQDRFNNALNALDNIGANDKEQSDKLRGGLKVILGKLAERL